MVFPQSQNQRIPWLKKVIPEKVELKKNHTLYLAKWNNISPTNIDDLPNTRVPLEAYLKGDPRVHH